MFVAKSAKTLQALVRQRHDATLALHGFDQNCRNGIANRCVKRIVVAPGQIYESGQERTEPFSQFLRRGRRDSS